MKKICVLSSMLVLAFAFSPLHASNLDVINENYISVEASASMETVPDDIYINFIISSENSDIIAAKANNAVILGKVTTALKKYGITEKNVQMKGVSVELKRERDDTSQQQTQRQAVSYSKNVSIEGKSLRQTDAKGKIVGYVVSAAFSISVKNIEKVEDIIGTCISTGVEDLSNVTFCISEQKNYRDELRAKALLEAKTKAEKMAAVLGRKIGSVMYIGNKEESEDAKCFDGPAPLKISIREAVQVKFELK